MTLEEFKAWFEGFTEGKDTFTLEDLQRIREKLAEAHTRPKGPVYRAPSYGGIDAVRGQYRPEESPRCTEAWHGPGDDCEQG